MRKAFGLSGATGSFNDIDAADAAILIGANPTEGHPVVGARIKQATMRGLKLVTIDPRRIELSDYGVLHLAPRPGTNAAVMLGLAHVVARDGFVEHDFVEARTQGYEEVEALLALYTPEHVEEITGIPGADIEAAAHIYAEATEACVLWGLGVTEHKYGSEVVRLICNLAMMTGKLGRPGSALLPFAVRTTSRVPRIWGRCRIPIRRIARSAMRRSHVRSRIAGVYRFRVRRGSRSRRCSMRPSMGG
jgi:formate dehydrogenase major subunit